MLESYGDMLSVEDVMEILGVGKNATYELFRTKEIQAFRLKNRWKIPKQAIIDYINQRYENEKKLKHHGKV
jgi:excisionase family DNA binding protein